MNARAVGLGCRLKLKCFNSILYNTSKAAGQSACSEILHTFSRKLVNGIIVYQLVPTIEICVHCASPSSCKL